MDKKMVLAIVVSMVILMVWPVIFKQKKDPAKDIQNQTSQQTTNTQTATNQPASPVQQAQSVQEQPAKTTTAELSNQKILPRENEKTYFLENDFIKVSVSSYGSRISQVIFKKYEDDNKKLLMLQSENNDANQGLVLGNFEQRNFVAVSNTTDTLSMEYKENNSWVKRTFSLDKSIPYLILIKTEFSSPDKIAYSMNLKYTEDESNRYGMEPDPDKRHKDLLFFANENVEKVNLKDLKENAIQMQRKLKWFGYTDRYFLYTLLSNGKDTFTINVLNKAPIYSLNMSGDGSASLYENKLYIGPKDVNLLKAVDNSLTASIDYGWLNFLCVPILELMKFFYKLIPNYGLAIIFLTIFIRLLLYPLQMKSMKSMKKLQELQPHIKKLQEKYKDDKQRMNQELMQFMKTHKVNPMGGCLPLLLQLPVFIALYNVLGNAVELYKSPFMLWIVDLSAKDPYYILPVLMVISMVLQQKLTPNPTMDPVQAKMMMIMPVVFGFLMINLPSGLTLYIFLSTILGVAQQFMMNRKVTQA